MFPIHASFTHALALGTHLRQVRLLGDMHRRPTWTRSHNIHWGCHSARVHLHPCFVCKPSTNFYDPFDPYSITIISRVMHFPYINNLIWGFPGGASGKKLACQPRRRKRQGIFFPGSGRSPGEVHGYQLQYSCLENAMERETWWATVHRITKNWTWLSDLTHTHGG